MSEPVTKECLYCKQPFSLLKYLANGRGRTRGGRFCSPQCANLAQRTVPSRICQTCGKEFRAQSNTQVAKFCGRKCYAIAKARPPYQCSMCGLTKTSADFTKSNTIKRGHNSICRVCASAQNKRFHGYPNCREQHFQHGAKRRGLEWSLSHEEFMSFWQAPCHYCGTPIATIGLDRINNELGYTSMNVWPCCALCNRMKAALPLGTFLLHCRRIAANHP